MPLYGYLCNTCGENFDGFASILQRNEPNSCSHCGNLGDRDCGYELNNGSPQIEEKTRWSEVMGCNPRQIKEMERKYPGSRYDSKGRLEITSRHDKLKKIAQRGLVEFE